MCARTSVVRNVPEVYDISIEEKKKKEKIAATRLHDFSEKIGASYTADNYILHIYISAHTCMHAYIHTYIKLNKYQPHHEAYIQAYIHTNNENVVGDTLLSVIPQGLTFVAARDCLCLASLPIHSPSHPHSSLQSTSNTMSRGSHAR